MSESNIENTQPTQPDLDQTTKIQTQQPVGNTSPIPVLPKKRRFNWLWTLAGIFTVLALGGLGTFIGYKTALTDRSAAYQAQVATEATEQFMLALQEQAAGNYEVARKRLEYVISLDPSFPGAMDKLTEVMIAMAVTKTPTPAPTPTMVVLTPTPDFRGEEDIFNHAKQLMAASEWESALETLDALRDKNPTYRAIDVDGLYYVCLRHRGYVRISRGQLETGIYDLTLTERFAPLDEEAKGMRNWARMYIAGASFWQVRWDQVLNYFSQIYPFVPNMIDINGITATERFRTASIEYAKQLEQTDNACEAVIHYQNAIAIRTEPELETALSDLINACTEPTDAPPAPEATPTATLDPALVTPVVTEEPTVEPTAEVTAEPTEETPEPPTDPAP
ncbi:MAG: hypothetical protein JW987_16120 [Anaerolineaceae bacterium]|nr:hypothetical protein [Anaerolineaceae bacterium]